MRSHYLPEIIVLPLLLSAPLVCKQCMAVVPLWCSPSKCHSQLLLTQLENTECFSSQERKWSVKRDIRPHTPNQSQPCEWKKTTAKGCMGHFFYCRCPVPSLSAQVHNPAALSAAAHLVGAFSVADLSHSLLLKTTSASQHFVYWRDLKGSLIV